MQSCLYKPAIVIVAFNRPKALRRLLDSIALSEIPENTPLVISIDRAEDNQNVLDIANNFEWKFGSKEVLYQSENIGLRQHVLQCGDLSQKFESIIMLEDDLYVSRYFYTYATHALNYYDDQPDVAGISLFTYPKIEKTTAPYPFDFLVDDSDVHFIQYASSWGQAWTANQWNGFREWFAKDPFHEDYFPVSPFNVIYWPLKSWKKFFIFYLIEHNKFFVYPNISLTSNFDDAGSNRFSNSSDYQTKLKIDNKPFKFKRIQDSFNRYNAYFEISQDTLKRFNPKLNSYDFHVDLYGLMRKFEMHKPYIITNKKCKNPIYTFARNMKPHEMNIIEDVPGSVFSLCKVEDLLEDYDNVELEKPFSIADFEYHYRDFFRIKEMFVLLLRLLKMKVLKKK